MKYNFRVWTFLTILSATMLIVGRAVGGRQGLLIGFILALTLNFYLFLSSDKRLLHFFKAEELKGQDPWGLQNLASQIAAKIRIPTPQIYLIPHSTPTAFSIGRSWSASKIIFSQGLLDKFSAEELKSALALQLFHVQKIHNLTSGMGGQLAELLILGAQGADSLVQLFKKDSHAVQDAVFPLCVLLMRLDVNPQSFLDTDQSAAKMIGDKDRIAEVLWKLSSYATTMPIEAPPGSAPFFVVNPLTQKGLSRYFLSHPPIEKRIENLIGTYPL